MDRLYDKALEMMTQAFYALSGKVGNPELQSIGDGYVYRYKKKSIYHEMGDGHRKISKLT